MERITMKNLGNAQIPSESAEIAENVELLDQGADAHGESQIGEEISASAECRFRSSGTEQRFLRWESTQIWSPRNILRLIKGSRFPLLVLELDTERENFHRHHRRQHHPNATCFVKEPFRTSFL
jgi:hypothetical protein